MSKLNPGETALYTDDNGVTSLATVINTYKDNNVDMATISLSGTDKVLKVENSFETE